MQLPFRILVLCIISVFEMWLGYQILFCTMIERNALQKCEKILIAGVVLVGGCMIGANRNIAFFSWPMFIMQVLVLSGNVYYIVRSSFGVILSLIFFYNSIIVLLDFLFAYISMSILNERFVQYVYIYPKSWWQIGIYIFSRLLVFGLFLVVKKKMDTKVDISEYRKILFVTNIVLMVVLVVYQYNIAAMVDGEKYMVGIETSISLLGTLSIISVISILVLKNMLIQKEKDFVVLQEKVLQEKYKEMEKNVEKNRCQLHDLKHDLLALSKYTKESDLVGVQTYLEKMAEGLQVHENGVWTHNRIWDFVIQKKKDEAEEKGIEMNINVASILSFPLDEREGCVFFGNLLDNAIEACEKIKNGRKWICVKIEHQEQLVFIEISNSICEKPKLKNGNLVTEKKQPLLHGYGLKSVKSIVEKKGGIISYQIGDDEFKVEISFFENLLR